MERANFDTTYCTKECEDKCWRHKSNYKFNENGLYWFTNECIKEFNK